MTPNLIELIVQAIDDMFERTYQTNVWPNKADIRSALASIPEMPQVDDYTTLRAENIKLKEALAEVIRISDRKHDAWDKAKALLTSPPTKTE